MLQNSSKEASLSLLSQALVLQSRVGERMWLVIDQEDGLSGWGEDQLKRVVTKVTSNLSGKLNPAVFPLFLLDGAVAEQMAVVCGFFHAAADLADDVVDGDLGADWLQDGVEQAFNASQGLLFLQQRLIFELPLADTVRLAMLNLFAEAGWHMHEGQRWDLYQTNRSGPVGHRQISQLKAGAEIEALIGACALAAGWPVAPARQYGMAIGSMFQIYSDHADVWLSDVSGDLREGKWTAPLQACRDKKALLGLLAGDRNSPDVQRAIRQTLLANGAAEGLLEDLAHYQAAWQEAQRDLPALERMEPVDGWLAKEVQGLADGLREMADVLRTVSPLPRRRPWPKAEAMAKAFLTADPLHRESWEVHRWGFLDRSELKADLFQTALIADVLLETGDDVSRLVDHVVACQSDDGWHYYPHEPGIPTDADDLGQVLQLLHAAEYPQRFRLCKGPVQRLVENTEPDGRLHTWLMDGQRYQRESLAWLGDECVAVMANGYYGLLCLEGHRHRKLLDRGARYLLSQANPDAGWVSYHYSNPAYDTYVVARFLDAWRQKTQDRALASDVDRCLDQLTELWRGRQRLDGGWGSPQKTALVLAFLLMRHALDEDEVSRGLIYLSDTQDIDGGWKAEDLYLRPGNGRLMAWHASRDLTTAFCLRALHQGRQFLEKRRGTQPLGKQEKANATSLTQPAFHLKCPAVGSHDPFHQGNA